MMLPVTGPPARGSALNHREIRHVSVIDRAQIHSHLDANSPVHETRLFCTSLFFSFFTREKQKFLHIYLHSKEVSREKE